LIQLVQGHHLTDHCSGIDRRGGVLICSSVTSRFKNVLWRLVAEVPRELLAVLLELLELLVVPAALGALAFCAIKGAATLGVNP